MSERSIKRALLRVGAVTAAAVLAFGVAPAFAQDDPTSTAPTTSTEPAPSSEPTPTPTETTTPSTPSSTPPVETSTPSTPPSSAEPTKEPEKQQPAQEPAVKAIADLKSTVVLDKTEYQSHETVHAKVTVKNQSQVAAENVFLEFESGLTTDYGQWGDLSYGKPGVRIEAGASLTIEVSGTISNIADGKMHYWGAIKSKDGDLNEQDNYWSVYAPVTQTRGSAGGFVYADKNRNGSPDGGEAVEGAKVTLYGGAPSGGHEAVTDANGRFELKDIPAGKYQAWYELPGGWVVHYVDGPEHNVTVPPSGTVDVTARGERPYSESLQASVKLEKDVYAVGEPANVEITLTNTGDRDISGIQAGCNRVGNGNQIGWGPGWGPFIGEGVTVEAGRTRTFTVSEAVPEGARDYGEVVVACDFEPYAGYNADGPGASDTAKVPGGFGTFQGQLAHDEDGDYVVDPGEGIADTKVVLVDDRTREPVTSVVTDVNGRFELGNVPAGRYRAVVVGPWKFAGEWDDFVAIYAKSSPSYFLFVVPGPVVKDPAPAATPSGGGGGTVGEALAKTGASVAGLGVLGALILAFGIGLRTAGRRKPTV